MSKFDCEQKLKELRERYSEGTREDKSEKDIFTPLSSQEKEQKISQILQDCLSGITQVQNEITENKENPTKNQEDLENKLDLLQDKKALLEQKLDYIRSGEDDDQRKERLKRTLLDLELKRSKLKFADKDCSKIDEKIKQKLSLLKKGK